MEQDDLRAEPSRDALAVQRGSSQSPQLVWEVLAIAEMCMSSLITTLTYSYTSLLSLHLEGFSSCTLFPLWRYTMWLIQRLAATLSPDSQSRIRSWSVSCRCTVSGWRVCRWLSAEDGDAAELRIVTFPISYGLAGLTIRWVENFQGCWPRPSAGKVAPIGFEGRI